MWVIITDVQTVYGPFSTKEIADKYFDSWEWDRRTETSFGAQVAEVQTPYYDYL